ncbi:hypothetical protein SALBM135S_04664 [Streptomyces alboniger]
MSLADSLFPMCEPDWSMYVVEAPWSAAATSKAQRVLVELFSKISAMFLPVRRRTSVPARFAAFSSAASASRPRNSSAVKSSSLRKWRPVRWVAMVMLLGCG